MQLTLSDIRRLKNEDRNDSEVREILDIPIRTYQRYIQKYNLENKAIWYSLVRDEMESELLAVRDCMLFCCNYAKRKLQDDSIESSEHLEWIQTLQAARMNLFQTTVDGPEYIARVKPISTIYPQTKFQEEPNLEPPERNETPGMIASRKYIEKQLAAQNNNKNKKQTSYHTR